MKICLTRFDEAPWSIRIQELFKEALIKSDKVSLVDSIFGYPKKQDYDILILCGIKSIIKLKLDYQRIKSSCKFLCDMSDFGNDPRKNYADICFYFVPTNKLTPSYTRYLPKVIDEKILFPEHNSSKPLTVFIDHFGQQKNPKEKEVSTLAIKKIFYEIKKCPFNLRVFYHHTSGILTDPFPLEPEIIENYSYKIFKYIPYNEICKYYRQTHFYFPTHRETQGMLAQEIGMCGGLTVLQSWMYPSETFKEFIKAIYNQNENINWNYLKKFMTKKQIQINRNQVLNNCNFKSFSDTLFTHLKNLMNI